jgi:hypothetical protein
LLALLCACENQALINLKSEVSLKEEYSDIFESDMQHGIESYMESMVALYNNVTKSMDNAGNIKTEIIDTALEPVRQFYTKIMGFLDSESVSNKQLAGEGLILEVTGLYINFLNYYVEETINSFDMVSKTHTVVLESSKIEETKASIENVLQKYFEV